MSLRGFFSRNNLSHSRRKKAHASPVLAAGAETLEDRVLLSVENPLLNDHGVTFTNTQVLDDDIAFFAVNNPLFSNNNAANPDPSKGPGSGLSVTLDGSQGFGNPPGTVPQVNSLTLSPSLGPLAFNNNANVGASISLSNLSMDSLVIDGSQFDGNGRAGLIINLNNVQIGSITIVNSSFANNANDGFCIVGNQSQVGSLVMTGNTFSGNSTSGLNNAAMIQFQDSFLGDVLIQGNQFNNTNGGGFDLDLDNTGIANLEFLDNGLDGNDSGIFFDFQDSSVEGIVQNNTVTNSTEGDGFRIEMRRSILSDGSTTPGVRNLDLEQIRGNTFSGNAGAGINIDLGRNTRFQSQIVGNGISDNGRSGINLQARDTQNAFDVQIGGTTLDGENVNTDANTIDANSGAGIAVTLDDTSAMAGNTTGRFRILGNTITNTTVGGDFDGEGIFVRARGNVSLVNGKARLLNSQVDGNTISGNAGHGIAFDISEDSEVFDLLIGDDFNPANPAEGFEGDGFFFQGQFFRNSGNIVQNNGGDGLNFLRRDAATTRNVRIIDNLFDGNANGIDYTVRNDNNIVNSVTIQHNDTTNNLLNGVQISTEIDASLIATMDNNLVSGNQGDGILTLGFEGDPTDAETFGGVWTRNTIQENEGRGININGVPGTVNPLVIGLRGTDSRGNSLGNLIDSNGNDGVEINAPGVIELVNNVITENGQNNTAEDVHGDGKGIDINLNDNDVGINTTGDLNAFLGFNVIQGNFGDGLEIISRGNSNLSTIVEVLAHGNIIDLNLGRGVDVLNSGTSDTYLVFGDGTTGTGSNQNIIRSNGLEGFYAVNTPSVNQRQDVDATTAMVADADMSGFQRTWTPDLTLDIDGNEIQQNGLPGNPGQLNGSGLVVRVGTSGSLGTSEFAAAEIADRDGYGFNVQTVGVGASNSADSRIFGNGRVNARVNGNTFGGNLGVDVITESFEATMDPPDTQGTWNENEYNIDNNGYRTDPLARLNLEFTNNVGDSIDLVRLGAFYNNAEGDFKSRTNKDGANPDGPFGNSAGRFRNAQRLPDRTNDFGSPFFGTGGLNSGFGLGVQGEISTITPGAPGTPIVVSTAPRSGSVFDATNADPIVITSPDHGLATGEIIEITGVTGNTAANGIFEINVVDQDTFELLDPFTGATVPGDGDYLGGGSWTVVRQGTINGMSGDGVGPIEITSFGQFFNGHGLNTGDQVTVAGVEGNTAANGTFTVTVLSPFAFTLDGTVGDGDWVDGTGAFFAGSGSHGLEDDDVVFLDVDSFDFSEPPGFQISGVYEVNVISPTQFQLNGTEGETDVPFDFDGEFREVTNDFALMYPGVGGSTFRIIESNNDFSQGNDFSEDTVEQEVFYPNSGFGHLSYTFDRETPGTFNFREISVGDVTVTEGEQAVFTFNLSEAMTTDLTINYRTEFAGSASDGTSIPFPEDYESTTDSVTIPAGETQASVAIDTISDEIFEDGEIFKLVIDSAFTELFDNASGFTFIEEFATPIDPFALATIVDDDSQPTISISDAAGFEQGDGSVGTMTFDVTLSNPSSSPVFVDFSTADFTANVNNDYQRNQGTLTFAPGETSQTVTVEILPDSPTATDGPDADQETLFVNLSGAVGATFADSQGLGTIFEPRFVSISDAFVNGDGDSPDTALAQFTVTLTDANGNPLTVPSGQTITVNFDTADGSATVGDGDYVPTVGSLVFTPFTNQMPLFVTANQDRVFEGDETFSVTISSEIGTIRRGTGTGNILEQYEVAATRDAGGQGVIRMFDARTNQERFSINPYPGFQGEVRVATGDFNGDGIADIVTSPGPGGGPHVKVLSGADGSEISGFMAYDIGFSGGVFVATGDINGDGQLDILTGPGAGGGPHVRVFDGDGSSGNLIENFFAVGQPAGVGFTGGIRVASGDVDGDGVDDIVLGYGPGGLPLVEVYLSDGIPGTGPTLFRTFNAYTPAFVGGVYVSTADIGGGSMGGPDGMADIITGAGPGGGPHVKVFNGDKLDELESFFAYTPAFSGGVRVASGDLANSPVDPARDRVPEIVTSPGPGGGPHVRGFSVDGDITTPTQPVANLFAFSPILTSGVYVSGRSRDLAGEGSPLMLEPGTAPATEEAAALNADQLNPVVEAALDRLSRAGIGEAALAQLRQLEFVIADLNGAVLGRQLPGRILIDRTAAGRGYFVDLTPGRDEEFSLIDGELRAVDASAQGRVDLLTVVLHELGHALGEDHAEDGDHLLAPTLSPGERRLPEYDAVFAEHDIFESLLHLS